MSWALVGAWPRWMNLSWYSPQSSSSTGSSSIPGRGSRVENSAAVLGEEEPELLSVGEMPPLCHVTLGGRQVVHVRENRLRCRQRGPLNSAAEPGR